MKGSEPIAPSGLQPEIACGEQRVTLVEVGGGVHRRAGAAPDPVANRIEPMTCAPNGFRSRDGLVMLQPGGTWSGSRGIDPFA